MVGHIQPAVIRRPLDLENPPRQWALFSPLAMYAKTSSIGRSMITSFLAWAIFVYTSENLAHPVAPIVGQGVLRMALGGGMFSASADRPLSYPNDSAHAMRTVPGTLSGSTGSNASSQECIAASQEERCCGEEL
jgi:hypothetical protein